MNTEDRNPLTKDIDLLNTIQVLKLINEADQQPALAIQPAIPQIAAVVNAICPRLKEGGRLLYVGTGTSGRLGVLDAAECPPTFGIEPDRVQGILAGGIEAFFKADESIEDNAEAGRRDMQQRDISKVDVVVGLSASGRTPYTMGAVSYARSVGALTVGISCNRSSPLSRQADLAIEVETGAEVLTGSTRMKAGTAQKMVLNMISTAAMIRLGHVYSNLMINVQRKNQKLLERAVRTVVEITGQDAEKARTALEQCGSVAESVIMLKRGVTALEARALIEKYGSLRKALGEV
ncbi:MAG: N-acetylmuramic acid 6-phosphate etherase [Acidobacteria bacterium]|nr:N-acetylmuramic acid 6-phosphate etherase [Acidobacteriota bacterium]